MSNPKRPDLSAIPRLIEPLDNDELTAHYAVPRELLDKLRADEDATRVGPMPTGFSEDERAGRGRSDSVHTSPTLPPPAPVVEQLALASPATEPGVRLAFPATSDAELHDELDAMLRPQRIARGLFVMLLVLVVAGALALRFI